METTDFIQERNIAELKEQLKNYQVLNERFEQEIKSGRTISAAATANQLQGLSARIDKDTKAIISPRDSYAKNEQIKTLLTKRQEYILNLAKAAKNELFNEAQTYSQWIIEVDSELAQIV